MRSLGRRSPRTAAGRRTDTASATASALAELLSVNGLEVPTGGGASHVQLTTGDVAAFTRIAERMFGEAFPDVAGVELGVAA